MTSAHNVATNEGLRAGQGHVRTIHLSAFDTYENVDLNRGSCNEWRERVLVSRAEVFQGRTAAMLILGQSNGANSGAAPHVPIRRVFNFNLFDGNCYVARDPLLGTTEFRGNFATRMGDMLIEKEAFDSILLAPISVGGSRIEDWTTGGVRHRRLQVAIRRAMDRGISFTHVLWHQGESNAGPDADKDIYVACFQDIRAALRAYGVLAPIYVAQASVCRAPPNDVIRSAQRAVVNPALGIFPGPDTDTIGLEDRFDDCHMAKSGLIKHAKLWTEILLGAENKRATEKSDRTCQSARMHQVATGPDSS
jgi:Carbohydrate esterase, sialic acid-specific acetylesterase